ncbi:unnamed protein product [Phaedon cochleariae]|uniref:DNA-directed DNA polymerase n=1 Tax=Phaedon cochleariae TaxID=80249 RepID=A0A9N9SBN3_PHACE|nr:unnamed protein product [Phaedon cochleariae]
MDRKDLKIMKKEFNYLNDETFSLLTKKGVFPYDYIDCLEKLNDTKLPPRESFYNKLNDHHISEEQYAHAQNVWSAFKISDLGTYSDIYLKTDVLLLADVFENFRKKCIASHGLDSAWYYTMPGYTWDAMLKYTKCKLELLNDVDEIMFIERAIRGGISVCSSRYAEANNLHMSDFDPKDPSKYLMYLDVNNLYGWAMSEYLPFGGFSWVDDVENFDVMAIADNAPEGSCLLLCDWKN